MEIKKLNQFTKGKLALDSQHETSTHLSIKSIPNIISKSRKDARTQIIVQHSSKSSLFRFKLDCLCQIPT